eukprot:TRINITY_DN14738_c0_g1_i1.p2 TRINITY_DN14738_c0_g1~~TRINITY_DN14738_c0_g1_i1.p2  ORF type:complete len:426 (+),score=133.94 TRINITY_DN14738_c0_g1_i1:226-1503(+)
MAYGATPEDRKAFNEMMKDPANKKCIDCAAPNPQWANIHHGVFICLECAGAHRGLGVHLSFVRSITMDKWIDWKPEKLKQMQMGGNQKAVDWFTAKGVPSGSSREEIKARYSHNGALMYKEKLEHAVEGKPWNESMFVPPPPPVARPITGQGGGRAGGYSGMGSPQNQKKGGDKDILDEVGKGFSKVGASLWAGAAAAAKNVKEGGAKAADSARSIDTGNVKQSAGKAADDAGKAVQAGWGWLSSNVMKAAASAQKALSGEDGEGQGKGEPKGPVGADGEYLVGETVVWSPMTGEPKRVVVTAVDDRTDPPTYILKLQDGGKRGAAHKQLRKWKDWQAEQAGETDESPSASASHTPAPSPPAASQSPAPAAQSPANYGGTSNSPTGNRPNLKPAGSPRPHLKPAAKPAAKAAAVKKDDDDWDDWD